MPLSELRYFLFHNVENPETWAMVLRIFGRYGGLRHRSHGRAELQLPAWPGTRLPITSEEAQALLATPIGGSIAWLLIQHKADLGGKTILSESAAKVAPRAWCLRSHPLIVRFVHQVNIFRSKHMQNRDTPNPHPSLLFTLT